MTAVGPAQPPTPGGPRRTVADLSDPAAPPVIVLSLWLDGVVYRFGTSALPGLDIGPGLADDGGYAEESSPGDLGVGERQALLTVLPGTDDATALRAALLATAGDPGSAWGELAQVTAADTWERREVLLWGPMREPEWAEAADPIRLVIAEELADDGGALLDVGAAADSSTWPPDGTLAVDERARGMLPPLIIGQPGLPRGDDDAEDLPAVPVPVVRLNVATADNSVSDATIAVAGQRLPDTAYGSVRLYNMSRYQPSSPQKYDQEFGVVITADADGREVSTVVATAPGAGTFSLIIQGGDEIYAAYEGSTRQGAGDVIAWALGQSTLRVAPVRPAVIAALNRYRLDGYLNQPIGPVEWLRSDVLPLLPVSMTPGPRGWEVTYWRLDAGAADADWEIDTARDGWQRLTPVRRTDASAVRNKVSISFAPRADTGAYTRRLGLAPAADPAGWPLQRYEAHPLARASAARYGVRAADDLQTALVWDPATAGLILADRLRLQAVTRLEVSYEAPAWGQALRLGDVVLLTDTPAGLSRVPCWVVGVSRAAGARCEVALRSVGAT